MGGGQPGALFGQLEVSFGITGCFQACRPDAPLLLEHLSRAAAKSGRAGTSSEERKLKSFLRLKTQTHPHSPARPWRRRWVRSLLAPSCPPQTHPECTPLGSCQTKKDGPKHRANLNPKRWTRGYFCLNI